jgi:outer membrane protein assembly factor BamB
MLKLNLAGIQYALGDLKAEDSIVAGAATNAGDAKSNPEPESPPANVTDAGGLKAAWWNNNSFRGEPVHTSVVTKFNPIVSDAGAPFPKTMSGLGPDFVSARFVGTFTPKVSGEFKFVSNADDYVALWVNGVEEIAWTGHTANDRFSTHSFHLVKNKPLEIRIDFRQDTLGYKLTLRLARQSDGVQIDFGTAVGTFTPASEIKPVISMLTTNLSTTTAPAIETAAVIDWPCFRGANHDGKSTDTGLLKEWPAGGPKKLWQFSGLGTGFSTVSVSGGTLYTSGDVEGQLMLFALDMDGKLKWKITHDRAWEKSYPGSRSTPTVNNERVYLVSGHGLIGCYDAKSGAKVWTRTMQELGGSTPNWGYAESVLIDGSSAIVTPGGAGCITALDKVTGKTLWQSKGFEGGAHYSSCIAFTFEGKRFVAVGTAEGLFCVDAATGEKSFFNPYSARNTANIPSPAFADGYVFWSTGTGKGGICLKLGPNGAEEAWKTSELSSHHGGFIIHEGFIYGNHKNGVACLDLKTGQQKWFDKTPGKGSLTFADGMLYLFAENDGAVTLAPASPNGMKCSGQFSVAGEGPSWAYPVVTGGCLYLRYGTTLYCFDVKTVL